MEKLWRAVFGYALGGNDGPARRLHSWKRRAVIERCQPPLRYARFTAQVIACSDAVTMFELRPTP